jgi:hypothetical protein
MEMNQNEGFLDLSSEPVMNALKGKPVSGYEGKKAQRFFESNPNAKNLVLDLLEDLTPREAQGIFTSYCRYSEEIRGRILQKKIREKEMESQKETAFAQ